MAAPLPVSRLFASLQPGDAADMTPDELENKPGIVVKHTGGREVQVTGTAELSAAPDRARDEHITISKEIERKANSYQMDAEVCVVFEDFENLQNICNMLVEKLDSSVCIHSPHFYHSPENMEKLRRQVCLNAVSNARRKAQDVCRLVGHSLGKAVIIREEEMKEWEDQVDPASCSLQHKIKSATVYAASKVSATFEIKGKERCKKSC
ncbi:interleukin-1 receptor-associated kinase 1-binding protein 1 isoform X2 [Dendropsophus ebraccatus]|uniref:interleukin-1 receptor-associated kinase 1-binding protein 1 isoform X2 n=1 Tax=Dendropsophus ebraccatus TaxID=150705 RepID=UPI0038313B22